MKIPTYIEFVEKYCVVVDSNGTHPIKLSKSQKKQILKHQEMLNNGYKYISYLPRRGGSRKFIYIKN